MVSFTPLVILLSLSFGMIFWLLMSSFILLLPMFDKSGVFILFGVEMMFGSVMVSFISTPLGKWVRLSKLKLSFRWWVLISVSWFAPVSIPRIPLGSVCLDLSCPGFLGLSPFLSSGLPLAVAIGVVVLTVLDGFLCWYWC